MNFDPIRIRVRSKTSWQNLRKMQLIFWGKIRSGPRRSPESSSGMNFLIFPFVGTRLACLDADPDSQSGPGSNDPIESGSNLDPKLYWNVSLQRRGDRPAWSGWPAAPPPGSPLSVRRSWRTSGQPPFHTCTETCFSILPNGTKTLKVVPNKHRCLYGRYLFSMRKLSY